MTYRNWAQMADNMVPIGSLLEELFHIEVPQGAGEWKTNCPLDYEHRDGGMTKAMKVFSESNSAYCFNHNQQFSPVTLWRLFHGESKKNYYTSAKELLEDRGILQKYLDPDLRWEKMDAPEEEEVDEVNLKEALRVYASTLPNYSVHQYNDVVLDKMKELFLQVSKLSSDSNYATLESWLTKSKIVIDSLWRENEFY